MGFDKKKYDVDGEAVSADEIIERAKELDDDYAEGWMHRTSQAAAILRANGHTVRELTMTKVVVEVSGGVAEVTQCPDGVDVDIIDHDNA